MPSEAIAYGYSNWDEMKEDFIRLYSQELPLCLRVTHRPDDAGAGLTEFGLCLDCGDKELILQTEPGAPAKKINKKSFDGAHKLDAAALLLRLFPILNAAHYDM